MRNKGFFWTITIALALACVYQLSFSWATNSVEKDADAYGQEQLDSLQQFAVEYVVADRDTLWIAQEKYHAQIVDYYADQYLQGMANEKVHFGYTYAECKDSEINLGLDLKGGISVTLEISVPDLVEELAGKTRKQDFRIPFNAAKERAANGEGEFIDLFIAEFEKNTPNEPMAKIFHLHNRDDVADDATNDEVTDFLKRQANSALDGVEIIIEKRVNSFGVAQPTIQKQPGSNRIFVELPGVKDKETVRRRLQSTANLEFFEVYDNAYDENGQPGGIGSRLLGAEQLLSEALFGDELGIETKDTSGVSTDSTGTTGTDSTATEVDPLLSQPDDALLDAPTEESDIATDQNPLGTTDSASLQLKKYPITSYLVPNFFYDDQGQPQGFREGSVVGYSRVQDTSLVNTRLSHPVVRAQLPMDLQFMWEAKEIQDDQGTSIGLVYLHAVKVPFEGPMVGGDDIDKAGFHTDPTTQEVKVTMNMTSIGAEKWQEMTKKNIGREVAITMDNIVYTSPVVQGEMKDGSSEITGNFTIEEAKELSGLLNAGALPAPAIIVDESIVGPSIGEGNINAGFNSFVIALCLVLIYMVFYYNKAGLIADLALIINIFFLVGALASMKAILTLPGIAGIVLTIGMSVDANVLIYERIREELRHGKGTKAAVKDGFQKAMSSIIDANITTLLTGIVLAIFGTGPIKGFATTLIIGIFTSFFAAVVITRLILTTFLDRDKKVSFSTKLTENWFTNTAIPFVRKRKLFYLISGGVIAIGMVSLFTKGLDLGVDFQGGRQYKVEFLDNQANYEGIRKNLSAEFEGQEPLVKKVDNDFTAMITTKYLITNTDDETNNLVEEKMKNGLSSLGDYEILESKMIAPTISRNLKINSYYAIIFSLIIIFLYIVFRFRKWQFGLGALIAMAHDVLVVLSLFSIFWGILPFSMEIDQAFIAAILTVVGYSINDTVVVFDRIREYLAIHHKKDQKEVINDALNSTLSRTINTSVSTFIVLLMIFMFGGGAIKGFTFALMIGVVVGTYSSLFIATPAVIDFSKKTEPKEIK